MKKLLSREEELKKVYRYWSYTDTMFFRPNLWVHSKRVVLWCEYICDKLIQNWATIDRQKVLDLAMIHDDEEIITGDIVAQDKLQFTEEQQKKYDDDCKDAFSILKYNYIDNFDLFDYSEYLNIVENKTWEEYMVVELADKLDAMCECFHEMLFNNYLFCKKIPLEGHWMILPYHFTWHRSKTRLDNMLTHFKQNNILPFQTIDILQYYESEAPENLETYVSWYEIYDIWTKLQFDSKDSDLIDCLTIQKEFLK